MIAGDASEAEQGYRRPPITEAVIELRFADRWDERQQKAAAEKFIQHYTNESLLRNIQVQVAINEDAPQAEKTVDEPIYRRSSRDETELVLIGQRNFTVSQLAPYPGWHTFFERFGRDWKIFRSLGYRKLARIGVRYINRIDLPNQDGKVEHERFLSIYPKVPELITTIGQYSMNLESRFPDIQCGVRINTASVQSPVPGMVAFMLDLDMFRDRDLPAKDEEIASLLQQIRNRKNEVFEACVTDAARERFGQ